MPVIFFIMLLLHATGDRIGFLSHTSKHLLEAILATLHCGAVAVPFNTRWTKQEINSAVQKCRPAMIICEAALLYLAADVQLACRIFTFVSNS